MTYEEKLKELYPYLDQHELNAIVGQKCPSLYFYAYIPDCENITCSKCWTKEYEEPAGFHKHKCVKRAYDLMVGFHNGRTTDIEAVIGYLREALDDHPEEVKHEVDANVDEKVNEVTDTLIAEGTPRAGSPESGGVYTDGTEIIVPVKKSMPVDYVRDMSSEPAIKDSGDRTQFETGAVRDMREGKGRCDLMPLEVVSYILSHDTHSSKIIDNIALFMDEKDTAYLNMAICDFAERAYNNSIPTMLLEVAKHYEEGAKKYGPDNWRHGIPTWCYIDSALRHYIKWLRGDNDEPHDRAFVWNLMCCIWEVDYHKKEET